LGDLPLPPLNFDEPDHTRFRQLLLPFFSPHRAAALESFVRRTARELVEEFADEGCCDAFEQFAKPLSVAVIACILGVSPADHERFADWTTAIIERAAYEPEVAAQAGAEVCDYIMELLDLRRDDPQDDVLSFLLHAEVEGQPTTDRERLGCGVLLLLAGIGTTAATISTSLWYLAQDPQCRDRIRSGASAIGTAVEELLRMFAPASLARVCALETVIEGRTIAPGDQVFLPFPSANRDEREFSDPDTVVLDRAPNRHLAFGAGIHRCLGAHIARLEVRVGLEEFLHRVPNFCLGDPDAVVWQPGPTRAVSNLKLIFV
jgi:cytochrome P450